MTALLVKKLFKSILLVTPFVVMLVMVSALWGIGGKTIYSDSNSAFQEVKFNPSDTRNYLLKGPKPIQPSVETPNNSAEVINAPAPDQELQPEKIKWELVV